MSTLFFFCDEQGGWEEEEEEEEWGRWCGGLTADAFAAEDQGC